MFLRWFKFNLKLQLKFRGTSTENHIRNHHAQPQLSLNKWRGVNTKRLAKPLGKDQNFKTPCSFGHLNLQLQSTLVMKKTQSEFYIRCQKCSYKAVYVILLTCLDPPNKDTNKASKAKITKTTDTRQWLVVLRESISNRHFGCLSWFGQLSLTTT